MDITDFYDTFFEEAEELLADMERYLLELDVDEPDGEQLNAIFRAAHSIKGGAGTFGFDVLQKTTHLFENLLDYARKGELELRRDLIDIFLETKDMLSDQLSAYRNGEEPDQEAFEYICATLQRIALEEMGQSLEGDSVAAPAKPAPAPTSSGTKENGGQRVVALLNVAEKDRELLVEELGQLGDVLAHGGDEARYEVTIESSISDDDIEAVMCFIVEADQLEIVPAASAPAEPVSEPVAPAPTPAPAPVAATPEKTAKPEKATKAAKGKAKSAGRGAGESTSLRVSVDKVDQIINLVGELIITQSMLDQTVSELEGATDGALENGMSLLQRNARDLQEAVMSIRMIPMDFVFSRFPRVVRETASKLNKEIELVTEGASTELDKSLTERIIDPLTHLVRNSLDHGIELPAEREAAGKPRTGKLVLSARHQGGNIIIEVIDDGAGLNREKLLAKARSSGLPVSDAMSDDEVWQLIFAPGFSTAKEVTDVSGRGVGMDVVKRNIQGMGGHVQIMSAPGKGTTIRIVLPLTLAR